MSKPLVNKIYEIEKYPGKGGWSYVVIGNIPPGTKRKSGMVRVSGTIDDYAIEKYNLMPMRDGNLFLPIKNEIRKKIGKQEGDKVHIILHEDLLPLELPEEWKMCLEDEPDAFKMFRSLSDAEQKHYLDWIYSAKKTETKINRMASAITKLLNGEKLYAPKS